MIKPRIIKGNLTNPKIRIETLYYLQNILINWTSMFNFLLKVISHVMTHNPSIIITISMINLSTSLSRWKYLERERYEENPILCSLWCKHYKIYPTSHLNLSNHIDVYQPHPLSIMIFHLTITSIKFLKMEKFVMLLLDENLNHPPPPIENHGCVY